MSRILIVEDDVVLARALKNWLERERLQVTCAITAANARRIIANEEVDMILSDLRLPDGDGIELLEWMKKNKCRIPLIIMTQHAEVSSAIRAMKAGAEDYLPKPIHPETLYPKLNDVLLRTRKTKRKQTDILQRDKPSDSGGGTSCSAGRRNRYVRVDTWRERFGERTGCRPDPSHECTGR